MPAAEPFPDDAHEWYSYVDEDGDTYLFDVTYLASNWHCIWGNGCKGVLEYDAEHLAHGCCSFGAHFADKDDRKRVAKFIRRLTPDQWQFHDEAERQGGAVTQNDEGEWVTRTHDGACIMLNRPGFSAGAGCALHGAALAAGKRPLDWKPDVCWQLPLRIDHHEDPNGHDTFILREWRRQDWGEAGEDFHWWCTDSPEAFSGSRPTYVELREELIEMVGEVPYARLVQYLGARGTEVLLPHPARRRDPSTDR